MYIVAFCCAAVLNQSQDIFVNGKQTHWKSDTINTRRMYLRVRMLVSLILVKKKKTIKNRPCFLYFFVKAPFVVLEWKSRFSCFLWTSLSSGIVLPHGRSPECLYIVTLLASLIPTYFHFNPLFSIRAVIDLHLSLNLHADEDGECSGASVRISVSLISWRPTDSDTTCKWNCGCSGVWDSKYIHRLLQSMSPVNDTLHILPYHRIGIFHIHTHTRTHAHAELHQPLVLLSDSDSHTHTHTTACSVLIYRLFTSNSIIFFPHSEASTSDKCH